MMDVIESGHYWEAVAMTSVSVRRIVGSGIAVVGLVVLGASAPPALAASSTTGVSFTTERSALQPSPGGPDQPEPKVPEIGPVPLPPGVTPEDEQRMKDQAPMFGFDAELVQISQSMAANPIAGTVFDTGNKTLLVYWKGEVPPSVATVQDEAKAQGYTVVVAPAAFNQIELKKAVKAVADAAGRPGGLVITLHTDGSGLTVTYPSLDKTPSVEGSFPAGDAILRAVDLVGTASNIPITIGDTGGVVPTTAARNADFSPYWGGSNIQSQGQGCTSAFGMQAGAAYQYMLTAAHCANNLDGVTVNNGQGNYQGYTDYIHELLDINEYDLALVRLPLTQSAPYFYADPAAYAYTVVGYDAGGIALHINAEYCSSGAVSRLHCGVFAQFQDFICPVNGRCVYGIRVSNPNTDIICHGDSGGPVFFHQNNDLNSPYVTAAGVVNGLYGYAKCSNTGWIGVVASAIQTIPGLTIRTG